MFIIFLTYMSYFVSIECYLLHTNKIMFTQLNIFLLVKIFKILQLDYTFSLLLIHMSDFVLIGYYLLFD